MYDETFCTNSVYHRWLILGRRLRWCKACGMIVNLDYYMKESKCHLKKDILGVPSITRRYINS